MRRINRLALATAATAALAAAGAGTATATTVTGDTVSPHIIGGTSASSPYIVQLVFGQSGGTYGCTGEAIAPQWILTAQHCIDGIQWMNVYFSNSVTNPGTPVAADQVGGSSYGDVALVHLSSSKSLNSYAPLASSYTARSGDSGTIWGYGLRANRTQPTHLYKATVNVVGPAPTRMAVAPFTSRASTVRPTTATRAARSSSAAGSWACAPRGMSPTRAATSTPVPTTPT